METFFTCFKDRIIIVLKIGGEQKFFVENGANFFRFNIGHQKI